jgi:hypothetical protein
MADKSARQAEAADDGHRITDGGQRFLVQSADVAGADYRPPPALSEDHRGGILVKKPMADGSLK